MLGFLWPASLRYRKRYIETHVSSVGRNAWEDGESSARGCAHWSVGLGVVRCTLSVWQVLEHIVPM